MKKTIEVVPYNLQWPEMFASEAELIKQALGNNCITIHHIGSTSVPGLSAKPIIDILPVVRDIQETELLSDDILKKARILEPIMYMFIKKAILKSADT